MLFLSSINFLTLIPDSIHPVIFFAILLLFLVIGDIFSGVSKAYIPGLFIFGILLLAGVWTNTIPKNIVELGGLSDAFISVVMVMIVVNMGSTLSLRDLKIQWKTVVVAIGALFGVALTVLTLGTLLFGWDMAVVATPTTAGGLVAAFEMKAAALAKNPPNEYLAMVAVLVLTLQNFPAFAVTPTLLKRIAKKELKHINENALTNEDNTDVETKKRIIPKIPDKYNTTAVMLFKVAFVSVLAVLSSMLSKEIFTNVFHIQFDISPTIFALVYGVISVEVGAIDKDELANAKTSGLFLIASFIGVMGTLATADKNQVMQTILPVFALVLIAMLGIAILSIVVGKLLKLSWEMSFVIGINCLLGFPVNYLLTIEAVNATTTDKREREYLMEKITPIMLVAGFTTITIGSVVMAGILKNFL